MDTQTTKIMTMKDYFVRPAVITGYAVVNLSDGNYAEGQGGRGVFYSTIEEAQAAQERIEASRAEWAAKRAAEAAQAPKPAAARPVERTYRPACQHGDYDCEGRCYSCGRVVVRGVGSYL